MSFFDVFFVRSKTTVEVTVLSNEFRNSKPSCQVHNVLFTWPLETNKSVATGKPTKKIIHQSLLGTACSLVKRVSSLEGLVAPPLKLVNRFWLESQVFLGPRRHYSVHMCNMKPVQVFFNEIIVSKHSLPKKNDPQPALQSVAAMVFWLRSSPHNPTTKCIQYWFKWIQIITGRRISHNLCLRSLFCFVAAQPPADEKL